ncbi:Sporulation kinase [Candidatus Syntrophocurvum alkaliphilum]|uniref:histidine kinase n=1 Tax=Candidatus Syntrophocurvum alkaliphilum TaxID=2293317 RepID=A0A6I6DFZ1_9FIRM|nr:PAS domain-containing sensor histidine kinase [Candidatus Syntrophocurvum alkaliphilum]QGT99340.1 Sporulation kinase [Candidatus Syntrophocurvum alkaliphilum]
MREASREKEDLISELISLRQENEKLKASKGINIELQQQMEQVIELLPDATLVINLQGQVVFWNKAMQDMTGVPKEQMIGKGNYEYAIPFYGERRPIIIDLVLMSDNKYSEIKNKYDFVKPGDNNLFGEVYVPKTYNGKGAYLWASASKLVDTKGNICGAISSIRDISDRKQAEKDLRNAEERFSKAFMLSPMPMCISTRDEAIFLDVNESFLQTVGYSREELIGRSWLEVNFWDDVSDHDSILKRLQNYEKVREIEIKYNTKLGEKRLALLSAEPIRLNEADCLVTMFSDITERKQMENDLARLDRLNLIGEMAASIGHEIRNPMTAIRGFIQLINGQERYEKDKAYFDLMIEELDRANGIISEYLRMAKDKIVNLQPHYIDNVVKAIYPMLKADANLKGMNIELDLGNPPMALIDKNEIRQLILNITRNGLEAMSEGGTLTIGTRLVNKEIILFISDQGHGLDTEVIDKLGTPFVTTKNEGTGLGLAVCYSIAARHNARIDFDTGPKGTTFYFCFPTS